MYKLHDQVNYLIKKTDQMNLTLEYFNHVYISALLEYQYSFSRDELIYSRICLNRYKTIEHILTDLEMLGVYNG
jgi:hypothetical protein